jgi:hypothetical protein
MKSLSKYHQQPGPTPARAPVPVPARPPKRVQKDKRKGDAREEKKFTNGKFFPLTTG